MEKGVNADVLRMVSATSALKDASANYENLTEVVNAFQEQADNAVKNAGVNEPQEFYDWAKIHCPSELQLVINDHAFKRHVSGYRNLVQRYHDQY